jgi:drug/metabolite transporter (DMT)-like permease
VKLAQFKYLKSADFGLFSASIFSVAGLIGILVSTYLIGAKKQVFQWKNVVGGICLGIPNYASMYYILKTLEYKGMQSSVVFPINNMGIIICSALVAATVFGEKLNRVNWLGIAISIFAIALIAIA